MGDWNPHRPSGPCVECGEHVSLSASQIVVIHFGCYQDRRRRSQTGDEK